MAQSHPAKKEQSKALNTIKWLFALAIVAAGITVNYMYEHFPASIRASIGILVACLVLFILGNTSQGVRARHFLQATRNELRKVVWPTRQETVRMTLIVLAIVIALALVLWGVDTLFFAFIRMITATH